LQALAHCSAYLVITDYTGKFVFEREVISLYVMLYAYCTVIIGNSEL